MWISQFFMLLDSTPPPIRIIFSISHRMKWPWGGSHIHDPSDTSTSKGQSVSLYGRHLVEAECWCWEWALIPTPLMGPQHACDVGSQWGVNAWSCPWCWDVIRNGVEFMLGHILADVHCQPTASASAPFWGNCPQQTICALVPVLKLAPENISSCHQHRCQLSHESHLIYLVLPVCVSLHHHQCGGHRIH